MEKFGHISIKIYDRNRFWEIFNEIKDLEHWNREGLKHRDMDVAQKKILKLTDLRGGIFYWNEFGLPAIRGAEK